MDAVQVELRLATDGVDGNVKAFDADGKEIPVPAVITVEPYFYQATAAPSVVYAAIGGDDEQKRSIIALSGRTGRLVVQDRSALLAPKFLSGEGADDDASDS